MGGSSSFHVLLQLQLLRQNHLEFLFQIRQGLTECLHSLFEFGNLVRGLLLEVVGSSAFTLTVFSFFAVPVLILANRVLNDVHEALVVEISEFFALNKTIVDTNRLQLLEDLIDDAFQSDLFLFEL